jgi:2-amino-4-hydroxy-6-hydroxymethyldihydropteridine diphosphokinase
MNLDAPPVYLLLGSNLGDRNENLDRAIEFIEQRIGSIIDKSSIYETAAWGKTDQPGFLNIALSVPTVLEPLSLLHTVLQIEADLGRVREEKWGTRLIDIDIILYGDQLIDVPGELQIPHPEMQNRKFVLQPLQEIASNVVHPQLGQTITELLANLEDPLSVEKQ